LRPLLFRLTGSVFGTGILFLMSAKGVVLALVEVTFGLLIGGLRRIAKGIMFTLDEERAEHARLLAEQMEDLSELGMMQRASMVKDDAIQRRVWTVGHTVALNQIGMALANQHGWEHARVHAYLRGVVESVPGLRYESEDEEGSGEVGSPT
jgi:hypothetical protein